MKKLFVLIGVFGLALLLVLAFGLTVSPGVSKALAQEPTPGVYAPNDGDETEAKVGGRIPVQGRLTDAVGNPLNGTFSIRFRLYDSSGGSTVICEDTNSVEVINGLFNSEIVGNCGSEKINGQQFYLGIKVGADAEMTDRQAIYPVPYAWSLRPGAQISGTVAGDAILHAENWASDGRALRGYARAATGANYGVVGASWSPDGFAGYFHNEGGGFGLKVAGGMSMSSNAGGSKLIDVGDRYRDNAVVAWAKIAGTGVGSIQTEFGVDSVDHYMTGAYRIYTDIDANSSASLIPMAIAEIDSAPTSAATIRIVSVNQMSVNSFIVYINNGNWDLVDNDFVFMVTAR